MLTTFKSLPSACELPIIVAMKFRFRIGAGQGGEQSPQQHRSVNPPLAWPPRGPVASATPPTQNPAYDFLRRGAGACPHFGSRAQSRGCARFSSADQPLRRGTACCARCSPADQRHFLATTRSIPAVASWLRFQPQPTSPGMSPATEKMPETGQHARISTRFWPKSRTYRKQNIKPCLPGSRIAQYAASELPSSIGQPLRRNR
jgi:hypothetical protein